MKKILLTMLGVVGMLCSTSCSDESIVQDVKGDQTVQFTVELNDGSDASRAISDGQTVDRVYYEVYTSASGEPVSLGELKGDKALEAGTTATGGNKYATIQFALVKGQTYDIVFWAQSGDAYNTDNLSAITIPATTANNESKDAFTAVKNVTVNGPIKETIKLTRPFAQVNFGTLDVEKAKAAGITFSESQIVVSNAATSYNALTKQAGEGGEVTFGWASNVENIANENLVVNGENYKYLATAYVLVPGDDTQKLSDLTMEIKTGLNENITLNVPNAPVKRNYRTNVLGNLLTNQAEFTVVVDPIYSGDYVENVDKTETVSTAEELQAAIDAAVEGNNVITFGANITATSIIVPQKEGINIVINGADHKFDGTFYLHGNARHTGTETLTFNGIKFEHADGAIDFIDANSTKSAERYAHNVIVNNCTFTGNSTGDVIGMRYRQCYNMTVKNSTFSNMHSLMWATGGDGVTIDGVTVENSKNGISFGTTNNVVVKNSNIASVGDYGYALRSDASGAYKMEVSNNTLVADAPILLRKATGAYALALDGNTLTTNAGYQIIVTASDYEEGKALTEPTGNYTLEGAEGYVIYPNAGAYHAASGLFYNGNDASWKSVFYLNNASDLVKAASYFTGQSHSSEANGVTFELKADIDLAGVNWTPWTVMWITLNGNGHKISNVNVDGGWKCGLFGYLGASKVNDLTIENVNIVGSQAGLFAGSVEGVATTNVKIAGTNSVKYNVYSSESYTETWGGIGAVTGVVSNSTINAEIVGGATVELDYNGITSEASYVDALTGYLQANKGAVVNNGTVTVVASSAAGLAAALKNGETEITLKAGTYNTNDITNASGKTLTLKGGEEGVEIIINQTNAVAIGTFDGSNITFENVTLTTQGGPYKGFARMQATYKNCVINNQYTLQAGKHVFEGCTLNAPNDEHCVWTYGAPEVQFSGCEFNYTDRCVNVYVDNGTGAADVDFTNCKFNISNTASKGAVEINSSVFPQGVSVDFTGCTAPAYGEMVFISGWDSANGANATVKVDGQAYTPKQLEK